MFRGTLCGEGGGCDTRHIGPAVRGFLHRNRTAHRLRAGVGGGCADCRQGRRLRRPRGHRIVVWPGRRDRDLRFRLDIWGTHQPGGDGLAGGDRAVPVARRRSLRGCAIVRLGRWRDPDRRHLRTHRGRPRQRRRGQLRRRGGLSTGHPDRGGGDLYACPGDHGHRSGQARPGGLGRSDHRSFRDVPGDGLRAADRGSGEPGPRPWPQRCGQPVRRFRGLESVPRIRDRLIARRARSGTELRPRRSAPTCRRSRRGPAGDAGRDDGSLR